LNSQVSIIIPVFNKADFLADCLDSVLGQSFRDLEVICIEDASDDRCGEILRDYANKDARLKIIYNDYNLGPAQSRNRGIDAAKGSFLRFVDADDLLPQTSTEILYARAIRDNVDFVKGSLATFRGNDPSTYQEVFSTPEKIRTRLSVEEHLWIPWWHTSYLISAELIHRYHLRYPNLIRGEDPVFLASVLVNAGYLSLVEQIVYLYRKYPKSSGSGGSTVRHVMDMLKHAAMTRHLFISQYPECWQRGYGPFLLNDVRSVLKRCELDCDQQNLVNAELVKIWGIDALKS
jgi:glycosyltransferase involved in cell wall biosynthesis